MSDFPSDLRYTKEHEWTRIDGNVLITDLRDMVEIPPANRFLVYTLPGAETTNISLRLSMAKGGGNIFKALTAVFVVTFLLIGLLRGVLLAFAPDIAQQHDVGFWGGLYITFLEITDPGNGCFNRGFSDHLAELFWLQIDRIVSYSKHYQGNQQDCSNPN